MHHHLSLRSKLIIMISVMASLFLVTLDQTIVATALGRIVEDFNAYSSLAWVVTAYLITTTITTPIAGKFSDLFGRRLMLLIGVSVFVLGSFLSGISGSIDQLVLWRALQGIGGGIIVANTFTIVGDLFAGRERSKWQGMVGAVFGISSIIGPLLGGFLTENHHILGSTTDWRWAFFINVPVGIIAFVVIAIFCPSLKHSNKPHIDYPGAALLAVALATLVLAVDNNIEGIFASFISSTGISLLTLRLIMAAIVIGSVVAFIFVERRSKEPILRLEFFQNRNFIILISVAMVIGAGLLGSILYLTQFNQQVYGASPTVSGLMLLPMIGGLVVASVISGQVVSRTGLYKRFMVAGFSSGAIAMGLLVTLTPTSSFLHEAIIMVFIGAGIGAAMPLMNIAIQNEFEQKDLGIATSSLQLFRGLGSTIGTAIFGSMLTLGITNTIGDMNKDAYIQTLRQSPAASKVIMGDVNNANTLLTINMPSTKNTINDGFANSLTNVNGPQSAKDTLGQNFTKKQNEYTDKIINAFTASIHQIFTVAALLMFVGLLFTLRLKEHQLRSAQSNETPG